jgi:cellulose synthase/poly-beta-1,6-N-acetylglucosamine synthase-like glycosyltransferase
MKTLEILFWTFLAIVFYTYMGYGAILFIAVRLKRLFQKSGNEEDEIYEPEVTLLIAAYNEKDYVGQKVQNSRMLDYPSEKLHQLWVTDGSDDGTPSLLASYPDVRVLHLSERNGKIAAMNRGMEHVKTPIVIFSDANTLLGEKSIRKIVNMFANPKTGCVSGEKRIMTKGNAAAAAAGEGLYWKYESTLKKWDAELNSVVGAAGELFSIRTVLYQRVEPDTLLDDFVISLRVAMKGYSIQYDPEAYAVETASANVKEELKRKIRIAAGGLQSIVRLLPLLNIFKYRLLSFQYISHRVLRWTLSPLALPLLLILNFLLAGESIIYTTLLYAQLIFYISAILGWLLERKKLKLKVLFVPYYFFIMNYAVYRGFLRFIQSNQSVNWERAKRG